MIKATYHGTHSEPLLLLKRATALYAESMRRSNAHISNARSCAARNIQKTKARARVVGFARGHAEAQEQLLKKGLSLQHRFERSLTNAHEHCLELALHIAREIIKTELITNHRSMHQRLKEMLASLRENEALHICYHPTSEKLLQTALSTHSSLSQLEQRADVSCPPDCVRIKTVAGFVELDWKVDFERFTNIIRTHFQRHGHVST